MKSDFAVVAIIGLAIGMLAQPVITNLFDTTPALRAGVVVGTPIFAIFCLGVARILSRIYNPIYQFAKFGAVGTLNSFIDFGILNIAIIFTGLSAGMGYSFFKGISFFAATTNSFIWNKYWTFEARHSLSKTETAKFYGVAVIGWIINVSTASIVVNLMGAPSYFTSEQWANVGALAGVATSFLFDFFGYKFWVFNESSSRLS